MGQSIYIDTSILIGYFEHKKSDIRKISRDAVNRVINMEKENREIMVKIPSIVLAEFMLWCVRNNCLYEFSAGFEDLMKKLNAEFPSPNKDHYDEVSLLMKKDNFLEPHDALVITHALLDRSTTWVLTTERALHNNKVIQEEKERLNNKFKISDRF